MIEPTHTFASFEITHFGAAKNRARFDKKEGTVQFDRAAKTGKVELTIDAASISSGVPQFDRHLKSADIFDVEAKRGIDRLLAALVPSLTVVMAVLVAVIMLAIMLPLMSLTSHI